MALFLKQDEQRSQLQEKVAASITERMEKKPLQQKKVDPAFLDNQKKTTGLAWVWIAIMAVGLFLFIMWAWVNSQRPIVY